MLSLPLIDEIISIRKHPLNIVEDDEYLFKHEYNTQYSKKDVCLYKNARLWYGDITEFDVNTGYTYKCLYIIKDFMTNYFHWFADTIQTLEYLVQNESVFKLNGINIYEYVLLVPRSWFISFEYIRESLSRYDFKYVLYDKNIPFMCSELLYVPHPTCTGNYVDSVMRCVRDRLHVESNENKRIYISRCNARYRKIINEADVIQMLMKYGFKIYDTDGMTFSDQIKLMGECEYLVSLHGAGLTNMLFMKENSNVLEIRGKGDSHNNCYFSLASALNLNYAYNEADNPSKDYHAGNCTVDIESLESALVNTFKLN